jgi:hypothetical protein
MKRTIGNVVPLPGKDAYVDAMFAVYNLKPGVSCEAFTAWSREVEQKVIALIPGVKAIKVCIFDGLPRPEWAMEPFDILEYAELEDWRAWEQANMTNPQVQALLAEFGDYVDMSSVRQIYAREL